MIYMNYGNVNVCVYMRRRFISTNPISCCVLLYKFIMQHEFYKVYSKCVFKKVHMCDKDREEKVIDLLIICKRGVFLKLKKRTMMA